MADFTDTANFTAGTNCTVESLQFHDFSAATGITLQQGLASGAAAITGGVARLTTPTSSRGITDSPGSLATCPRVLLDAATDGNFDVQIDIAAYATADLAFTGLCYRVDDTNYILIYHYYQTGVWKTQVGKWVAGTRNLGVITEAVNSGPCQLRLERTTNDFVAYVREAETDAWTTIDTLSQAFGTTGNMCVVADYFTSGGVVTDYDNVVAWSGLTLPFNTGAVVYNTPEVVFLTHDSAQLYLDAAYGFAWDNSTADDTDIGSGTIKYQIADAASPQGFSNAADAIANADWNGTWLTPTEYRALADTGLRYRYQKVQVTGVLAESAFTDFSMTTYSTDVTPPGVPTSNEFSLFNTNNYAMIWQEPTDADYDHCELRRTIDSVENYLQESGGLPVWDSGTSSYWTFRDDGTDYDHPASNWINEDVSGTTIMYYARSVDESANASAWTAFTAGTGSNPPAQGTMTISDLENGTDFVYEITGGDSSSVNTISYQTGTGDTWTTSGMQTGDGSGTYSVASSGAYWFKLEATDSGGKTVGSIVFERITDGEDPIAWLVAEAIADDVTNLGLKDSGTALSVSTALYPYDKEFASAEAWVYPDLDDIEATPTSSSQHTISLKVDLVQTAETEAKQKALVKLAQGVIEGFNTRRVSGLSTSYIQNIRMEPIIWKSPGTGYLCVAPVRMQVVHYTCR